MIQLLAMMISAAVAYIPTLLLGDRVSLMTDFLISTVIGGAAYVATLYWLKKLRGDF